MHGPIEPASIGGEAGRHRRTCINSPPLTDSGGGRSRVALRTGEHRLGSPQAEAPCRFVPKAGAHSPGSERLTASALEWAPPRTAYDVEGWARELQE